MAMSIQDDIQALISQQSPEIQEIAQEIQRLILSYGLEIEEDVSLKLNNLYYKHNGVVAALSLHKRHANLHFYRGTELSDPENILAGQGAKLRHIKFTHRSDINPDILKRYFLEAYRLNDK
jgi:hypothetical protein